ncbi:MAG: SUMF1/EgtB/PvdO family nonheme iron enzyme [Rhodobacteraceae bacterium]|nr:SUMF1/EgtB/PvdO family nonheme iron enzyme [Paracoccaceae bacterium]
MLDTGGRTQSAHAVFFSYGFRYASGADLIVSRAPRKLLGVLRGGSWINNPRNARAANRNRNNPDNRDNNVGFRVLCSGTEFRSPVPIGSADQGLRDGAETEKWRGCVRSAQAHVCRAYIEKRHSLGFGPGMPYFLVGSVRLIQPPSIRPSSITMRLTCSYWLSFSQRQWCMRRR